MTSRPLCWFYTVAKLWNCNTLWFTAAQQVFKASVVKRNSSKQRLVHTGGLLRCECALLDGRLKAFPLKRPDPPLSKQRAKPEVCLSSVCRVNAPLVEDLSHFVLRYYIFLSSCPIVQLSKEKEGPCFWRGIKFSSNAPEESRTPPRLSCSVTFLAVHDSRRLCLQNLYSSHQNNIDWWITLQLRGKVGVCKCGYVTILVLFSCYFLFCFEILPSCFSSVPPTVWFPSF